MATVDNPHLGQRRFAQFSELKPKLAANLRTHALLLRETQSPESRMWRHVNSYSPRYPSQIPEIAAQYEVSEELVKLAYQEGKNAKYLAD